MVDLTTAGTLTISFSASTTRKAITCDEYTIGAGKVVSLAAGSNGLANDAADPGNMTDATGVSQEHLFVRGSSCESNVTTYTATAAYTGFGGSTTTSTSNSGTAATSIGARGESKIETAGTSTVSDPTYTAADCASAIVGLDEVIQTDFIFVNKCWNNNVAAGTTLDCLTTLNVATGDLLVAWAKQEDTVASTCSAASVSGSPANTFTFDAGDTGGNASCASQAQICAGYVLSAAADVTMTPRLT